MPFIDSAVTADMESMTFDGFSQVASCLALKFGTNRYS